MNIVSLKFNSLVPSEWSKGLTYEYFIYPTTAKYSDKDFLFRVSSATITEGMAKFTNFIGYTRYIAMLDAPLNLSINSKTVEEGSHEVVKFQSEDDVISYSVGQDLNLMVKEDIKESSFEIVNGFLTYNDDFIIVIALEDTTVVVDSSNHILKKLDAIVIENETRLNIDIISGVNIAVGTIKFPYQIGI
ncbi:HutD family protein [Mycoplasma sp. P36-A1]|uniref:HutD family protein n=1 Tax=Mycoplasma sp. P36-A1 TaxID=3252900 RepID=UPI003C2D714D